MKLLLIATAPIVIILAYIYVRDIYEKEPVKMLLRAVGAGMLVTLPVLIGETFTSWIVPPYFKGQFVSAFAKAFLVASFWEETLKYLALFILVWRNKHFNERFDGIVYAVFVSLGFALVENVLYVFSYDNGMGVGVSRAFTAVPAHAIFGVLMGYYFGLAKFNRASQKTNLLMAWLIPFALHGGYDFMLMANHHWLMLAFIPSLLAILVFAHRKITQLAKITVVDNENNAQ